MSDTNDRLAQDAVALTAMAEPMPEYLDSDILYWPAPRAGMPMVTLGGFLMREHRLLALAGRLSPEQQVEVSAALGRFNYALADRIVRFEQKAHVELDARLRQWEELLKDMEQGAFDRSSNYSNAVETRAIIQSLVDRLAHPPYKNDERQVQRLAFLDTRLKNRFQTGDFVWPEAWKAAYPQAEYWWLYGAPRKGDKSTP